MVNSKSLNVTNFPEDWKVSDVKESLEKVGRVKDVYMLEKRNRLGQKFVFVRFNSQENIIEVLATLKGLWIGNYKILANIARFNRGETEVKEVRKPVKKILTATWREEGKSYVHVTQKISGKYVGKERRRWRSLGEKVGIED